jgi:cell division protein FtsI (penicillin-binding protein 3)
MTFVLQSEHVAPTGTKVLPVALDQKELNAKKREETVIKASQVSVKQR